MFMWEMWKKGFYIWEKNTAIFYEQLLKSPLMLTPAGSILNEVMKGKAALNDATAKVWGSVGLSTKKDQERTLHALNMIQSRLSDLEEKLEDRE